MDKQKLKDIELIIWDAIYASKEPKDFNTNEFVKKIAELYKPAKVKLPKAAYEWMEEHGDKNEYDFDGFLIDLFIFYGNNSLKKLNSELNELITDGCLAIKLVDAYHYGYELEETEEERIKRVIRETLHQVAGVMVTDELVDSLYSLTRGGIS